MVKYVYCEMRHQNRWSMIRSIYDIYLWRINWENMTNDPFPIKGGYYNILGCIRVVPSSLPIYYLTI